MMHSLSKKMITEVEIPSEFTQVKSVLSQLEKTNEESLKAGFEGKLSVGKSTKMESIKIVAKLEKTDELKREIRESPEFKKCMVEVGRQGVLSPVCSIVRHQAAALDKIHLTIEAPKIWSRSSIL